MNIADSSSVRSKPRFTFRCLIILASFLSISSLTSQDTLVVGYTEGPPFVYDDRGETTGISTFLWEAIASELNLKYRYEKMSFADMLGNLEQGKIDLSINALTVTNDRLNFMEFSFPFYSSNSSFAVRKGGAAAAIRRFFRPVFTLEFLGALFLMMFVIFSFGFLVSYVESRNGNPHFRKGVKGIWDGIWWSSVTVTTVGYGDKAPKSRLGKIFALLWMFVALIFFSSLTAGLTSNFTQSRASRSSTSFQDFKEESIGTVRGSGTENFLKQHFFKDIHRYDDLRSGLIALSEREIDGFTYDEPIMRYRLHAESSLKNIRMLPLRFDDQFYAFGFRHGLDSLVHQVNREVVEYTETKDWEMLLIEYQLGDANR